MQRLTITEKALITLCSNALFGLKRDLPTDVNWQDILQEAERQAVLPITLSCKCVPEYVRKNLVGNKASVIISNNMRVNYSHAELHELLTTNAIPYVVLKGCASASFYPNPILRSMGDVDFLVAPENVQKVDGILQTAGFVPWNTKHPCHIVYTRDEEHLELHFEPAGIPEGKIGDAIRGQLASVFQDSKIKEVSNFEMSLPSDYHHGLIILLHTVHHLVSEGVGLRHLCDWAVFVNHFSDEDFKLIFEERFTEVGLWRTAQLLTLVCVKFLGCTAKECVGTASDDLLRSILTDILDGGNFGIKDFERSRVGMILSNRGKSGVGKKTYFGQFMDTLNHIIYNEWPFMKTLKIFLPIAWMYWGIRFQIRVLMGKRQRLNVTQMVTDARQREAIYKEFQFYETKAN